MSKNQPDPRQIDLEDWLKGHEARHEAVRKARANAKADEVINKILEGNDEIRMRMRRDHPARTLGPRIPGLP